MSYALRFPVISLVLGLFFVGQVAAVRAADEKTTVEIKDDSKTAAPKKPAKPIASDEAKTKAKSEKAAADVSEEPSVEPKEAVKPRKVLSADMVALRDRVRHSLAWMRQQPFNTRENTVGEILSFCSAFGCDTEITDSAQTGQKVNGITCVCWNMSCAGNVPMMLSEEHLAARIGYGYQDGPSQLASVLAMSRVPPDYPARAGETVRTVADLIEYEKLSCRAGTDMSLKLIAISNYVHEPTWKNSLGEGWSLDRIIQEELDRPVANTAHGATTRLLGLSYALDRIGQRDKPLDGDFLRAKQYVDESIDYAIKTENSDGSWGRATSRDYAMAVGYSGHMLEWLAVALPENRLEGPEIVRAVDFLQGMLASQHYQVNVESMSPREINAAMHAAHALVVYDQRIFAPADAPPAPAAAPVPVTPATPAAKAAQHITGPELR